jgi:hypothetical protein
MGTTYEYTYDYEVTDTNKHHRNPNENLRNYAQRTTGHRSNYGISVPQPNRTSMMDSLANLQHDRIWHKLYDPLELNKLSHETEIQVCYLIIENSLI